MKDQAKNKWVRKCNRRIKFFEVAYSKQQKGEKNKAKTGYFQIGVRKQKEWCGMWATKEK